MACWIAAPGSVAVAFTVTRLQPSAPVACLTYVASLAQAGSAHWMKPTFFVGGTLVSAADCSMLVGTVTYLSRFAWAAANDAASAGGAPAAADESAELPHAARVSMRR